MYDSKYYTCEQIDERLLQNYFNDFVQVTGYNGTKEDYHNLIFSITPLSENLNKKIDVNISNIGISNFSPFSAESTYVLGNIITYNGKLYKCILAVETAGAWSESNWEVTSIYKILYDFIDTKLNKSDFTQALQVLNQDIDKKEDKIIHDKDIQTINNSLSNKMDKTYIKVMTEDAYDALPEKEENILYFLY